MSMENGFDPSEYVSTIYSEDKDKSPTFNPNSIYNETYEDRKKFQEDIRNRRHNEIYRNDQSIYQIDLERGIIQTNRSTFNQLEEDLASMYSNEEKNELLVSEEKQKEIFRESCIEILNICKFYTNPNIIQKVFPNIDLQHIKDYDFGASKIKFFLIKEDEYKVMQESLEIDKDVRGRLYYKNMSFLENKLLNGLYTQVAERNSDNNLIIISEKGITKNKGIETKEYTKMINNYKNILKHEILHTLIGRNKRFPKLINEGIINSLVIASERNIEDYILPDSYLYETRLVRDVSYLCGLEGLDKSIIKRAFVSEDEEAIKLMRDVVNRKMGAQFANKFFTSGFAEGEETYKAYKDLFEIINKYEDIPDRLQSKKNIVEDYSI